jgi:predicted phage terminase large subunit-like protein
LDRWGDKVRLQEDAEAKQKFDTTAGGTRISSSFGGSVLGRGGDIRIIDDPHKVDEVESERSRRSAINEYDETIKSRVTDPKHTAEVIIMHRVHEEDLSGHVLAEGDCVHLMLPAEFESSRRCITSIGFRDPRRRDGELLWPSRWGKDELATYKRNAYLWAGQYQQSPVPRGGGIIKAEWWRDWPSDEYPACEVIIASLDTAYTQKQENDSSALTIWGLFRARNDGEGPLSLVNPGIQTNTPVAHLTKFEPTDPKLILMYAWEGRVEFPELVQIVGAICSKGPRKEKELRDIARMMNAGSGSDIENVPRVPVDRLIIEAKANGISVAQELGRQYSGSGEFGVELVDPTKWGDKHARVYAVQHMFAEGMIYAPDRQFAADVIANVTSFPRATHDDYTDSTSLALRYMRLTGLMQRKDEVTRDIAAQGEHRQRERPLYGGV